MFRSGGSAVLRRFQQEIDAGRIAGRRADHVRSRRRRATDASKGMFVPFKPKNFDKIPDAAKDKDGNYVAQRLNMMTIYLRTDKVARRRRAEDLERLSPIPNTRASWSSPIPRSPSLQVSVVGMMSKDRGWGYLREAAQERHHGRAGQSAGRRTCIKRGERLIAVGALDSYAAEDRAAGHPIKTLYPTDGVFVIPSPTAVIKGGPNPNAAKLFAEFMISDEVQKLFPADGGYCRAQRHAGARPARPRLSEHQDHAGRLRLHREGSRRASRSGSTRFSSKRIVQRVDHVRRQIHAGADAARFARRPTAAGAAGRAADRSPASCRASGTATPAARR